jgi:hypothetical protein
MRPINGVDCADAREQRECWHVVDMRVQEGRGAGDAI